MSAANLDYLYDAVIVLILFSLIIVRHERLQLKIMCERLKTWSDMNVP